MSGLCSEQSGARRLWFTSLSMFAPSTMKTSVTERMGKNTNTPNPFSEL